MTLDTIMNWLMPTLILFFFVALMYIKLKEPTDIFLGWIGNGIKNLLTRGKEKATETIMMDTEVVFE